RSCGAIRRRDHELAARDPRLAARRSHAPRRGRVSADRAAQSIYAVIWAWLGDWFRVPAEPPTLPSDSDEPLKPTHPAKGFLRYLKLGFWLALLAVDLAILFVWLAIVAANPPMGMLLVVPALLIAVVPDIVVYVALHLRYDTTWYVMSSRSLRIRR